MGLRPIKTGDVGTEVGGEAHLLHGLLQMRGHVAAELAGEGHAVGVPGVAAAERIGVANDHAAERDGARRRAVHERLCGECGLSTLPSAHPDRALLPAVRFRVHAVSAHRRDHLQLDGGAQSGPAAELH